MKRPPAPPKCVYRGFLTNHGQRKMEVFWQLNFSHQTGKRSLHSVYVWDDYFTPIVCVYIADHAVYTHKSVRSFCLSSVGSIFRSAVNKENCYTPRPAGNRTVYHIPLLRYFLQGFFFPFPFRAETSRLYFPSFYSRWSWGRGLGAWLGPSRSAHELEVNCK